MRKRNASSIIRHSVLLFALGALTLTASGCVYFNTFYNARKNFNSAEEKRRESAKVGAPNIEAAKYKIAIEKATIILEKHANSKFYDDALYVVGVSYYWTGDYFRSQRKLRELLANHAESKFAAEAKVYLAKCKLGLGERAEAVTIFQNILTENKDRSWRADAAFAIGDYYFEQKDYPNAESYYRLVYDSLGDDAGKRRAGMRIADGLYARVQPARAKQMYLRLLDIGPSQWELYRILFRAGECDYVLQKIDSGLARFGALLADQRWYDSIGSIRLQVAKGHEYEGDLVLAIEEYENVALESPNSPASGSALHNLGLIYQFDYQDYDKALKYYEEAKTKGQNLNPSYPESVKRAADISALSLMRGKGKIDSSATTAQIDDAAKQQLKLADLYLFELGLPDSALGALQFVLDSLPSSYYAPRAELTMALIQRDFLSDTAEFKVRMDSFVMRYPRSDFFEDAMDALGERGGPRDTGYSADYYRRAERFLWEEDNVDSAIVYYRLIGDSFPNSNLAAKARFALATLTSEYRRPEHAGDSAIIKLFEDIAEDYPTNDYGILANQFATAHTRVTPRSSAIVAPVDSVSSDSSLSVPDTALIDTSGRYQPGVDTSLAPELLYYVGPTGAQLRNAPDGPQKLEEIPFIFPETARSLPDQFDLYFHLLIDLDGSVREAILKNPKQFPELNELAKEQVMNFIFNMGRLGDKGYGDGWFVFKYRVVKPEHLR